MGLSEVIWDFLAPHDCLGCANEGRLVCERCWQQLFRSPPLSGSSWSAVTEYSHLAKQLVRGMKVDCHREASLLIGRALAERAPAVASTTLVTAVPTADARRRERGFDHSAWIAREFARCRGLRYQPLLIRLGRLKQAGASVSQRQAQLRHAFIPIQESRIAGRHIVLIDDVVTTGSTIAEVTAVLKKNRAASVEALVFARTV